MVVAVLTWRRFSRYMLFCRYGTLLMEEAERIARFEHRSKKLAVISGVGTRHYYRCAWCVWDCIIYIFTQVSVSALDLCKEGGPSWMTSWALSPQSIIAQGMGWLMTGAISSVSKQGTRIVIQTADWMSLTGCHWMDVTHWMSLIGCHWLDVTDWMSLTGCHSLDVTHWMSLTGCHSLDVTEWMSLNGCHWLDVTHWMSLTGCHSLDVTHWMSLTGCHWMDVTHWMSLTGPHSLDVTDWMYSLDVTHWMSLTGCTHWMSLTGCHSLDVTHWMSLTGCHSLDVTHWMSLTGCHSLDVTYWMSHNSSLPTSKAWPPKWLLSLTNVESGFHCLRWCSSLFIDWSFNAAWDPCCLLLLDWFFSWDLRLSSHARLEAFIIQIKPNQCCLGILVFLLPDRKLGYHLEGHYMVKLLDDPPSRRKRQRGTAGMPAACWPFCFYTCI